MREWYENAGAPFVLAVGGVVAVLGVGASLEQRNPAHEDGQIGAHTDRLPDARFVGSCIRSEAPDGLFERLAHEHRERPRAYVSLGSFLSARTDVLQRIMDGLRTLGWNAVIATGATDPQALGTPPPGWIVREHLPQVAALEACDIVVCHGGNNTVTDSAR